MRKRLVDLLYVAEFDPHLRYLESAGKEPLSRAEKVIAVIIMVLGIWMLVHGSGVADKVNAEAGTTNKVLASQ